MNLKLMASRGFNAEFSPLEVFTLYAPMVQRYWRTKNCDLYVFNYRDGEQIISMEGYDTKNKYVKPQVIDRVKSIPTKKFWCKINQDEDGN